MPIQVTCPGCLTRFQVNEKFAGRTGPCPKCKKPIKIPDKSEQVVIHAPEEASGPKDAAGRPVLKPIEFQDTKVTRKGLVIGIGSVAVALIGAIVARFTGGLPMFGVVAVAILLAPPLAWAAYTVLREQELEPFIGQELLVRVLISSVTLVALWLLYWWLPPYLLDADSISKMSWVVSGIALTLLLLAGGFASMLVFEFDYGVGVVHCGMYLVATFLLALIAGVPLAGG